MRLTMTSMNNYITNNLNQTKLDVFNTQKSILSGKKINTLSDSPIDTSTIIDANKSLNEISNYLRNITMANAELNVTDTTYENITERLQRCLTLTMTASNETNSAESISAIKAEIDQITDAIMDTANTKYNDQYIFAGTNTVTTPFTKAADGSIECNATNKTGEWKREMEISEGVNVQMNTNGAELFGHYKKATLTDPAEGSGIFGMLGKLSDALGKGTAGYDDIRACLDEINVCLDEANTQRVIVGTNAQKTKLTQTSLENTKLAISTNKSTLEDTDIAEAATKLASQQYAYEASMAISSQMLNGLSLLNYL